VVGGLAGQPVALLACGWRHTLAVTAEGQVYAWGRGVNGEGALGLAGRGGCVFGGEGCVDGCVHGLCVSPRRSLSLTLSCPLACS
jgi:hypothetical protein